jgi:alpha-glucosidase
MLRCRPPLSSSIHPLLLAALVLLAAAPRGSAAELRSPDGRIVVTVGIKERLEPYPAGPRLYYSVAFRGRKVLLDSPLGLDFADASPLARGLVIEKETPKSFDTTWERVAGKSRQVRDHGSELTLDLREASPPGRRLQVIFRAYDDGVAFRYVLPEQAGLGAFRLAAERTEFCFAGNHTAWAAPYGSFTTHQESEFFRTTLGAITPASIVGLPLLVQVERNAFVAITEADLRDWAGMYLSGDGAAANALVSTLSPRPDEPGVAVRANAPHRSPWRVLMIADHPGRLVESNLVVNLATPLQVADTSWIRPGRSAWDRWWSGDWAPGADFKVAMNTATMKYFTDLAARMGWEYVLVDWGWYGKITDFETGGDLDCTKPVAEVDVPEIVRYAREKNVRVLLWIFWTHLDRKLDEALALYEKWGIAGIKVDFMARDDQWMVNWYETVVKKAAAHHLAVDFHGAFKPTGLERAYPNHLTREGVLGNEYNKWSDRVTPEHKVTLPFTRMLAGPMDFTPGGFRHATRATFKAQDSQPMVMGTRAAEVALLVVYESPLQVLCDSPDAYRDQVGASFLKEIPTTWDETRVLAGEVGQHIAVARRSGRRWFLGALSGNEGRTLDVPLAFLGEGPFRARVLADSPEAYVHPELAVGDTRTVRSVGTLTARMAPGGGFVAILEPAE